MTGELSTGMADANAVARGTTSQLAARLALGEFAFTAELTPPVSCDAEDLLRAARPLKGLADAVNVTDGAGARAHMSAFAASVLLLREGIEPVLQMTCRDRNRIALQADLMGAAALGLRNLLVLNGDSPQAGDQPDAKGVFDLTTDDIARTARDIRDAHVLPTGHHVGGEASFFIGGADTPVEPAAGWAPTRLKAKREAGIRFVQTQFCMDAALLRRYMARLRDEGLVPDLAYLIGIAPLRSAKGARWMREKLYGTTIPDTIIARMEGAHDPQAEGIAIAIELIEEIGAIAGIAGVHLMAPKNEAAMVEVIRQCRGRKPEAPR